MKQLKQKSFWALLLALLACAPLTSCDEDADNEGDYVPNTQQPQDKTLTYSLYIGKDLLDVADLTLTVVAPDGTSTTRVLTADVCTSAVYPTWNGNVSCLLYVQAQRIATLPATTTYRLACALKPDITLDETKSYELGGGTKYHFVTGTLEKSGGTVAFFNVSGSAHIADYLQRHWNREQTLTLTSAGVE